MSNYHLTFVWPVYLLLLGTIPLVWLVSFRRLASLGPWRRWIVLLLRSAVIALLVLTLAEAQFTRTSERLTVVYLLDQSLSIPTELRRMMVDYVAADIHAHRKSTDRAGVVVFGRDAAVERSPFDGDLKLNRTIESIVDPQSTNLAAGLKLAQAMLPEDSAKRIVLVSDGNENLGNAMEQAEALAVAGVGIDVVPIRYQPRPDIAIERVTLPPDARRNEPFDVRIVVTNSAKPSAADSGAAPGRLVLSRTASGRKDVMAEEHVVLPPGKKVFSFRQTIDSPDFYAYEAKFLPDNPDSDASPQNNHATAFTHVQGKGRTLLIENHEQPGEFNVLVERLRRQGLEVESQPSDKTFSSLAELQPFDAVILADAPREQFTDGQVEMLAQNTQQMGAGLLMIGGPNSFGAGGWADTEVEKALPVDCQIRDAKVVPQGALALVIDNSGSMMGEKVEMCKEAAISSVKTLGPTDYVCVVVFSGDADWIVRPTMVGNGQSIIRRIRRIGADGGTNMYPGMTFARDGLQQTPAAVKHMVVLSDGQTMGSGYEELARDIFKHGITISTVAVGPDANATLLDNVAQSGGGKFYRVTNPRVLPRIFMQETRRVARPLIWDKRAVRPVVQMPSQEILAGIASPMPMIKGYVMTSRKRGGPLVETLLTSPEPPVAENNTLLACWTYGLGKSVAFTSDAGARWTTDWTGLPLYEKFFSQMVRWAMRPIGNTDKFTVASELVDGRIRVSVNALDRNDDFLNFLNMTVVGIGPDGKPLESGTPKRMEQTLPGRYAAAFPTAEPGNYFFTVNPGGGHAPIRFGMTVPYSDEFRDREPNGELLGRIATLAPQNGRPGSVIPLSMDFDAKSPLPAVNSYRHDLMKVAASQDAWHYFLFAACCMLFADVFCRRVQINFGWVATLAVRGWNFVRRRPPKLAAPEFIGRLQSRKTEMSDRLNRLRAEARFETPTATPAASLGVLQQTDSPSQAAKQEQKAASESTTTKPVDNTAESPTESYAQRLLRAKKSVWEEKK
jgi:Mg-chelatase subunit ChlD